MDTINTLLESIASDHGTICQMRQHLRLMNWHWYTGISASITCLSTSQQLIGDSLTTEQLMWRIARRFSNLTSLHLHKLTRVEEAGLRGICRLQCLDCLDLSGAKALTTAAVRCLGTLSGLKDLDLSRCLWLNDVSIRYLSTLTALTRLGLNSCRNVSDGGLKAIGPLKNLRELDLGGQMSFGDKGVMHLRRLTALTKLRLSKCAKTTGNEAVLSVGAMTVTVGFQTGFYRTNPHMVWWPGLEGFKHRQLTGCMLITDRALKSVRHWTDLSGYNQKTDVMVRTPRMLTLVSPWVVRSCQVTTNKAVKFLRTLKTLESLELSWGADQSCAAVWQH